MIRSDNGMFHLGTGLWSCLLRVTEQGLVEQIRFGAPVSDCRRAALPAATALTWA